MATAQHWHAQADEEDGQLALFIDNSNLFIEGKKFYAKYLSLRVTEDPSFRIDIGCLLKVLIRGRNMNFGKLYGSEPPSLDTVWTKIREHGLLVDTYQRDAKGKEKELGHALTADATEYVCVREKTGCTGTIILFSGGRDYCPLVEKILEYGWRVEITAFAGSINSKLKDMKNDRLEVNCLDNMVECPTRWYFVNRKWNPYKANRRRRIPMPRSGTMVLEFDNKFDAKESITLLRQLANELTQIMRVPCLFSAKCTRDSQVTDTVYIIEAARGIKLTKEQQIALEEANKWRIKLEKTGLKADEIEKLINEDKSNQHDPAPIKTDFFQVWKQNKAAIITKCQELLGKVKHSQTLIDYRQGVQTQYGVSIANPMAVLYIEGESESDEEAAMVRDGDTDYDYDDYFEDGDADDEVISAPEARDVASGEQFKEVGRKNRSKPDKTYTEICRYSFNCNKGLRCGRIHTQDEVKFFKENEGNGARRYKSIPCIYYIKRMCLKGKTDLAPMCPYYHTVAEARCYQCKRMGGEIGHAASDCTKTVQAC